MAFADIAHLRSWAGSLSWAGELTSAWLTARLSPADLPAVEICISAHLHVKEDLSAGQDGEALCACDRSMTAGGNHSLICGALLRIEVPRHSAMTEA